MSKTVIHLRAETKPLERRSPLSPTTAKALLNDYDVRVERSNDRIYKDEEYAAAGATLIENGSWANAPQDHIILGLKELPETGPGLSHDFIHFQHCFKKQDGWANALARYRDGKGKLYDLEFLVDENGRRVAAFGYWAGYAGTAIALLSWAHQVLNPGQPQGPVPVFDSAPELVEYVNKAVTSALAANNGEQPRVIIIGALGRCGQGAAKFCSDAGLTSVLKWDLPETKKGGPFQQIAESDVFVNCVYLGPIKIPPFTTFEALSGPERRLRVICDVSCDPNSENNPIPVYSTYSSFNSPTVPISREIPGPEVRVVAIDHLPTLIARESSDEFAEALLPSLKELNNRKTAGVWTRAEALFEERKNELPN